MDNVKIWEEIVKIPTYEVGAFNENPMFLEKRVYQGSSGKVYPNPVIDKILDEKVLKEYRIIFIENQYIQIQIMPEIGGRVYRAIDKTNNYDFVYYNKVIKPALVGLTGPWISGGIEFNWPQHHRPNTYGRVNYTISEDSNNSKTLWVSEIDKMYGTKVTTGFTLYADKSYIEISAQMYNDTSSPQTFLWWANPALAVHDETQSIFPPDVHAVFDHGKRDVSKFPIATGTYYKMDYSKGVDISKYKNIPVPTSYMAYHSDYDFIGGYDYKEEAGILHFANHHVSPGKKQWTWGNGEFGKAWDRNLTDEDGPYIELMTGVYTDNQPDFTWLQPYEEKNFKQYFMPYRGVGEVKNSTLNAAIGINIEDGNCNIKVHAMGKFSDAEIILSFDETIIFREVINISPSTPYSKTLFTDKKEHELTLTLKDSNGKILVSYKEKAKKLEQLPDAAKAIEEPEKLKTNEALFLAGQHLEQYRHATYEPADYYLEGLKRDENDIRINNAYGNLCFKRGDLEKAAKHFKIAIETSKSHNLRPYDSEPYYNLGKTLKLLGDFKQAYDVLYSGSWAYAFQSSCYYLLSQIDCLNNNLEEALDLVSKSIELNIRHYRARNLKTAILRKLNRTSEAIDIAEESINLNKMDFGATFELVKLGKLNKSVLTNLMNNENINPITLASEYIESYFYYDAIEILEMLTTDYPMKHYYLAYCFSKLNIKEKVINQLEIAEKCNPRYCFPNTILDMLVLENALKLNIKDGFCNYYLGNLYYDKKMYSKAISCWEQAIILIPEFPTSYRNLALAYVNKQNNVEKALIMLEKAFDLNKNDSRVFYELDQLYKKMGYDVSKRLTFMDVNLELVFERDDLFVEYLTLLNIQKEYNKVVRLILNRTFHPWEGGEGKVSTQYILANVELAKLCIDKNNYDEAIKHLETAKVYPLNIGEGKLLNSAENNIDYYLGLSYLLKGDVQQSNKFLSLASKGINEPTGAIYYNDQPPHMIFYQGLALISLNKVDEAKSRFNKLINYGEVNIFVKQKFDFFAVSLPDFLVFEEDLDRINRIHCNYMMALGHLGLGNIEKSQEYFDLVMSLDKTHQGAKIHYNTSLI